MNDGIVEQPYGAPLVSKRVKYEAGQGASKVKGEAVVLHTSDNQPYVNNRSIGGKQGACITDLVLEIPTNPNTNVNTQTTNAGALMLQIPDGNIRNGNARGNGAVDFQVSRNNATQVASGNYSFACGSVNTASGPNSVALGYNSNAAGNMSFAMGINNTASGHYSFAQGESNTCSNTYSAAIGAFNTSSGSLSIALGKRSNTNGITTKMALGYGTAPGNSQLGLLNISIQTTDSTANTKLKVDTSAVSATNQLTLINNQTIGFTAIIVGQVAATASVMFEVKGLIRRGANASATSIIGTPLVTQLFSDVALTTTAVTIGADTTNGCLSVGVTGVAATTINWNCAIYSSEVI